MTSGGLKLGVGLSLGLSLGLLASQESIAKRIFSRNDQASEKTSPSYDAKLIEQLLRQDRKVNQLESQLSRMREDLHEFNRQAVDIQATQTPVVQRNGDVFELSQVIQANNVANAAKYEREMEELKKKLLREHMLKVESEVLRVENKYTPIINKIRELEVHLEMQRQVHQKEKPSRLLWMSCQSLLDRLQHAPQGPLEKDPAYTLLKQYAAEKDTLAISLLDSLPVKALKEGVSSEQMLYERFNKVDSVCKRVALVDSYGGGLYEYMLSFLQSLYIPFERMYNETDKVEVLEDEVRGNRLVDPSKWSTFDILSRVKYCLLNHELEQAVRYANQLSGQARVVARDWIRDARDHLVTRQAFSTLSTHAEAMSVDSVIGNSSEAQQ